MIMTININSDKLDDILQDNRVAIKNTWTVQREQLQDIRGISEERLGYAASVKRSVEAGGIYGKPESGRRAEDPRPGASGGTGRRFIPTDSDRADLPKYAALVSPRRPEGGVTWRGDLVFHLNPGIRGRTTFTPRDSSSPGLAGASGVTGPDHLWPLLVHGDEELIRLAFAEATEFAFDAEMQAMAESGNLGIAHGYNDKFFEGQVHGDISWSDISGIKINCPSPSPEAVQEAAEAANRLKKFASANGIQFLVEILFPPGYSPEPRGLHSTTPS